MVQYIELVELHVVGVDEGRTMSCHPQVDLNHTKYLLVNNGMQTK